MNGALLRQTPRWLLVAGFAVVAGGANLLLGLGAASSQRAFVLALAIGLLPACIIAFGALVEAHRAILAWIALGVTFVSMPFVEHGFALPGGTRIFLPDALLLLAFGAWLADTLTRKPGTDRVQLSVVFSWPLALFAATMIAATLKGHERYGASIVGQPLRIVLYSGIALALTATTAATAWKAITRVFYAGAIIQSIYALYYLATGTSQTNTSSLSTGGVRLLALGTAIYLTGSLICALLNLELARRPLAQLGHACVAALALFGIVVAFGRTTYVAVALIVPLLLAMRRYMRRTVLLVLPLFAPLFVGALLLAPTFSPDLLPTLENRLSGTSSQDINVAWRAKAVDAALKGVDDEWLTGVGFGRELRFVFRGAEARSSDDPHNSFVYLLAGGGVLVLGSFVLLSGLYVVDAVRRLRRADAVGQALIVWALGTWLAFMLNAASGPVFPQPAMLLTIWILIALPSLVPRADARPVG